MKSPVEIASVNFRFTCQAGCVTCCTQPGDVYLTEEDLTRIAAHQELSPDEFEQRYCTREDGALRLTNPGPNDCHFLDEGGCKVHQVKPLQCGAFPFWPENVASRRSWKALRRYCPGVGIGEILPLDAVTGPAQACADAFPDQQ